MTAPKLELIDYTAPAKVNPYAEYVAALTKAVDADPAKAATLTIDVADKGKTISNLRNAAKDNERTLRILREDDSTVVKDGQKENGKPIFKGEVTLIITVVPRYKEGRGRKTKDEAEVKPAK